ncbi:alpha/beta hydrolase [Kaistella palustris]|uniref:alpha/beta hydrolase n=1 Tax=Kaistella palustris TaxID=493376 RepID=UPI00041021C3|nr:alpha/beta fold hydrolase [Kaistella palustris]
MGNLFQYLQEKVVFLPVTLPADHEFIFENDFEEYFWETPHGGRINAVHFKTAAPKGAILYLHGNAGNLERWGKIAAEFTEFGYDILVPDYRGYGKSVGPRNEEFLFSDVQFCYDFLKENFGEECITVYGRSLGGAFATKIAADNRPAKVILEAAFFNLQDMASRWIPYSATEKISPKMTYHFLSDQYIKKTEAPLYHFHGTKDFVVPLKSGKKLFDMLKKSKPHTKKKFIEISGGSHEDLATFEIYKNELRKILD